MVHYKRKPKQPFLIDVDFLGKKFLGRWALGLVLTPRAWGRRVNFPSVALAVRMVAHITALHEALGKTEACNIYPTEIRSLPLAIPHARGPHTQDPEVRRYGGGSSTVGS